MMSPTLQLVAQAATPVLEDGWLSKALSIAGSGLLIVFLALILISLFIAALPKVLVQVGHLWPEVDDHKVLEHDDVEAEDDPAILAAIGFVLHTEFQRQLSSERASDAAS